MERPGFALGQLFFYVLLVAGIVWLVVHLVRRSRGTGATANTPQARWHHAVQVCSADPRYRLGQVTAIGQVHPQRGTFAWVTLHGTGQQQNTWFENAYPPAGAWVVVSGAPAPDGSTFNAHTVHDVIA